MLSMEQLASCGVVPVVVLNDVKDAVPTAKALLRGGNALLDQLAVLKECALALLLIGGKGFARLCNLLCRQRLMAGRADGFRELFRVNRTPAGTVIV